MAKDPFSILGNYLQAFLLTDFSVSLLIFRFLISTFLFQSSPYVFFRHLQWHTSFVLVRSSLLTSYGPNTEFNPIYWKPVKQ